MVRCRRWVERRADRREACSSDGGVLDSSGNAREQDDPVLRR